MLELLLVAHSSDCLPVHRLLSSIQLESDMSARGRSLSPRPLRDEDVDMDGSPRANSNAKVVIVTNLTRNVVESHLQTIFGFYGEIVKVDLPVYGKCEYMLS